ncbi:MAG: hypothetical protein U1F46_08055 [Marinagarivorans sp.]
MSKLTKRSRQFGIAILSAVSLYAPHIIAQPNNYYQAVRIENTELDLDSYQFGLADINNKGTVVAAIGNGFGGYIYKNGISTRIIDGHEYIKRIYINDNDQVAGIFGANRNGFFYEDGYIQDIGTILPIDINNNGQIIGKQGSQIVSYLKGTVSTLELPQGVTAVNSAYNAAGNEVYGQVFTYINGVKQIIDKPSGVVSMDIRAINDDNKAVGSLDARSALLIDNGTITAFGTLENRIFASASDINGNGTIVGTSYNPPYSCDGHYEPGCQQYRNFAAFIIEDGLMTNLTGRLLKQDAARGVKLTQALAINDFDFIVAQGFETGKGEALYLLTPTPVPLPASVWMFLSGLSIFGALRRLSRDA